MVPWRMTWSPWAQSTIDEAVVPGWGHRRGRQRRRCSATDGLLDRRGGRVGRSGSRRSRYGTSRVEGPERVLVRHAHADAASLPRSHLRSGRARRMSVSPPGQKARGFAQVGNIDAQEFDGTTEARGSVAASGHRVPWRPHRAHGIGVEASQGSRRRCPWERRRDRRSVRRLRALARRPASGKRSDRLVPSVPLCHGSRSGISAGTRARRKHTTGRPPLSQRRPF